MEIVDSVDAVISHHVIALARRQLNILLSIVDCVTIHCKVCNIANVIEKK
jgi:hypothetical protein